ncbi:MAG TPA: FAD binding domain-containing protein [Anaerolineales bacterium]|jgi:CO/xanthine dehydrogenase FAD-binding subunit
MITNYHRPQSLEEALKLLNLPDTRPLGGGTWLNQPHEAKFSVVDLQALGFDQLRQVGNNLELGACVTLQQLLETPACPDALKQALRIEAGLNIRNSGTLAGTLVTCDGRSPFATVMLALDAHLTLTSVTGTRSIGLGEYLPLRPQVFITSLTIPLNVHSSFESIARTPLDKPIVCAALARWSSGRTRLALGGASKGPLLALDGTEPDGIEAAASSAYQESGDEWASTEYRMEMAAILARRCLDAVSH